MRLLVWLSERGANDPGRTRTCNPRLRGPMPYPLGHGAFDKIFIANYGLKLHMTYAHQLILNLYRASFC